MMSQGKRILAAACLALCATLSTFTALGAGSRVNALLERFPAQTVAEGQKTCAELMQLGPEGAREICDLLVPPGTGDDTKARYALSGLAKHVSRSGAEAERKVFAETLIGALAPPADKEVKGFLIQQLQVAGREESVAPLAGFLIDERLCEPATQALLAIRTTSAAAALLKALPAVEDGNRVTIIQALGVLRCKSAAERLIPYAESDDMNTRQAALYAIANIADPSGAAVLAKAVAVSSSYERTRATAHYLLYARRLVEEGRKRECAKICRDLLETRVSPRETHVRCAALSTLVDARGRHALGDLLTAGDDDDKEFRAAALALADKIPGSRATKRWVNKIEGADPVRQSEIIAMLGRRGHKGALPALVEAIGNENDQVRRTAIAAAARVGGGESLPRLLAVMQTDNGDDIAEAKAAILRLPGEGVTRAVAEAFPKSSVAGKVAILEMLVHRESKGHDDLFISAARSDEEKIRTAALKGLGAVASGERQPDLVALLLEAKNPDERKMAQDAIVAAGKEIGDPAARTRALLAALESATADQKTILLDPLGRLGGEDALQAVHAERKSSDENVREAAVRALTEWPDAGAAGELLNVIQSAEKLTHRVLAVRGYVRIVSEGDLPPEKKARMYDEALAAIERPEEKKLVLAALADVQSLLALDVVAPYLDDDALKTEAALAAAKIACPPGPGAEGLKGPSVLAALGKVMSICKDDKVREQVGEYIGTLLNLAHDKPVEASVPHQGDNTPERAVDGDRDKNSAWFGLSWPASLKVDLQQAAVIDTAHVIFCWDEERYCQYTVDVSPDGRNWKTVADMSRNTNVATAEGVMHRFTPMQARYVRINVERDSMNPAVQLVEFRVYAAGAIPESAVEPAPGQRGFASLFNGKDLTGWTGATEGYLVEDEKIVCPAQGGGNLYTENEYGDFTLRFDFRLAPDANNGLGIRAPLTGNAAYEGMELQILDDTAEQYKDLQPYQYHGSIYGVVPAKRGHLSPIGEWNSQEVIAKGPHIAVNLNGVTIVDADLSQIDASQATDGKDHPGLKRTKGHIGFLGHGSRVEFRSIRVREE